VILTEKASASRGIVEALRGLYANFLMQEFIGEAKGADLRCFVVGDQVVASMQRQAPEGDFRSNLHAGVPPWRPRPAVPSSRWRCVRPRRWACRSAAWT
jgi:glutathione synthase/RimK-type ligase-like ATP-grasp enzyme